jgi:hypothetical protein
MLLKLEPETVTATALATRRAAQAFTFCMARAGWPMSARPLISGRVSNHIPTRDDSRSGRSRSVQSRTTANGWRLDSDWYFRQEQFESLRRDYLDADHALRDHGQYTDRQLRELNKEILGRLNVYTAN